MKLLFVGDIMLGRLVNEVLRREPPAYVWGSTLPIFRSGDFRVANLECAISDRGEPWSATPKVFHFRTDAKNVEALKIAKIDAVSLANNHALDFGDEALIDTVKILDHSQIYHAGVGKDLVAAQAPAIFTIKGKKFALISATDNEPQWEAGKNQPGIYYLPIDLIDLRVKNLINQIKKIKTQVDWLIVALHWGPNWGWEPLPEQREFAHALIDAGADIIYGHSPHIFRGIEIYQQRLILYSTGDFIDDYAIDEVERNDWSFIFIIEIEGKKISRLILHPTIIDNFQAKLAPASDAAAMMAKMTELCSVFGTKIAQTDKTLQISKII